MDLWDTYVVIIPTTATSSVNDLVGDKTGNGLEAKHSTVPDLTVKLERLEEQDLEFDSLLKLRIKELKKDQYINV